MTTIWHIEDDPLNAAFWKEHVPKEWNWKCFECPYVASQSAGNPDAIVFDVGCIGLQKSFDSYMRVFHRLRDRFPHTMIYLVSGLPSIPEMMVMEIDDDLVVPLVVGRGVISSFLEHWENHDAV